jgi:hypothetical protein
VEGYLPALRRLNNQPVALLDDKLPVAYYMQTSNHLWVWRHGFERHSLACLGLQSEQHGRYI